MARKLKRPDGELHEEFVATSAHFFDDGGRLTGHNQDTMDGDYTGRFLFRFYDGTQTRWYTRKTAPKWLLAYFREATGAV